MFLNSLFLFFTVKYSGIYHCEKMAEPIFAELSL